MRGCKIIIKMLKDKNKMYARLERNKNWVQSQGGGGGVQQYSGVCRIVKKEWGLRRLQRRRWAWVKPVQRLNRFGLIVYIWVVPVYFHLHPPFSLFFLLFRKTCSVLSPLLCSCSGLCSWRFRRISSSPSENRVVEGATMRRSAVMGGTAVAVNTPNNLFLIFCDFSSTPISTLVSGLTIYKIEH